MKYFIGWAVSKVIVQSPLKILLIDVLSETDHTLGDRFDVSASLAGATRRCDPSRRGRHSEQARRGASTASCWVQDYRCLMKIAFLAKANFFSIFQTNFLSIVDQHSLQKAHLAPTFTIDRISLSFLLDSGPDDL